MGEPAYVRGGYEDLGEVTVRPAGSQGKGLCLRYITVMQEGKIGPHLDLYLSGMNLGQDTGSCI